MVAIYSRTSHFNRNVVIYRSELVILPLGLSFFTTSLVIFYGHCTCQTILGYAPVVLVHTPPTPDKDVSMYLTSYTFTLVSSYKLVGLDFIYVKIRYQSLNTSNNVPYFPNATCFGFATISLLNDVQRPFPDDKPISARQIFLTIFSNIL